MIYFVQALTGGPIKIGYTENVWKRLNTLRSSNAQYLILLGVMEGDRQMERRIHGWFKKVNGEWFQDSPQLREFIRLNCEESLRPCPALDVFDGSD